MLTTNQPRAAREPRRPTISRIRRGENPHKLRPSASRRRVAHRSSTDSAMSPLLVIAMRIIISRTHAARGRPDDPGLAAGRGLGNPRPMTAAIARLSVSLDDVRAAGARIAPYVHRTPVLTSRQLDAR